MSTLKYAVVGLMLGALVSLGLFGGGSIVSLEEQTRTFAALLLPSSVDYEPATGPRDLAKRSELVALGRIGGFSEGRSYGESPDLIWHETAVMQIIVDEVLAGELPDPDHRSLYFELPIDSLSSVKALGDAAPTEARVLVYAVVMAAPQESIVSNGRGMPPGQLLLEFTTPQGFLVDVGDGVFAGLPDPNSAVKRNVDLNDYAPPRDAWPHPHEP